MTLKKANVIATPLVSRVIDYSVFEESIEMTSSQENQGEEVESIYSLAPFHICQGFH